MYYQVIVIAAFSNNNIELFKIKSYKKQDYTIYILYMFILKALKTIHRQNQIADWLISLVEADFGRELSFTVGVLFLVLKLRL